MRAQQRGILLLAMVLCLHLIACDDDGSPVVDAGQDTAADTTDVTDVAADLGDDTTDVTDSTGATDVAEEPDEGVDLVADAPDASDTDASDSTDSAQTDATDTGDDGDSGDEPDTGPVELPLHSFGELTGSCDFLDDAAWSFSGSWIFTNTLHFGDDVYDDSDLLLLSEGGQRMVAEGGLNDSSLLSEIMAYEVLYRCELAKLLETEGTIDYSDPNGPKTDFLAEIDERKIGVSVVRGHPLNPFADGYAQSLLEGKLQGIINSTANVTGDDVWERQILSVITSDEARVRMLVDAYPLIDSNLTRSTIIVITRTDGEDQPVYCEAPTVCPSP